MQDKISVWAWRTDAPHGGFLFHGNPNPPDKTPPYHLNGVLGFLNGERLVWATTRKTLEMDIEVERWNLAFPQFRIKPVCIMVDIRKYYRHKRS